MAVKALFNCPTLIGIALQANRGESLPFIEM
uniref:Uncharacterized protein n=1 Tax=Utricularia reniformis TaxID=192314 RepID=A0A1Y0AZF4_9LAMI|nr:hypothetical protein AEK19_MT0229 [Utricularia reniformis]ART30509.1 hypothetical protein AEK19_MT0229 [Utricularia reniformis]